MAKRKAKKPPENIAPNEAGDVEEIVGPAKLHEGHVQRPLESGRKGWRNIAEHPLTYIYEKGQLERGSPRYSADDRFKAGDLYRTFCETLGRSGRDCLDLELISRPTGFQISETKANAMTILARIDARLQRTDQVMLRRVCGDGCWPSEAVREACGHDFYHFATVPRFVEALDNLIEAMRTARQQAHVEPDGGTRAEDPLTSVKTEPAQDRTCENLDSG